MKVVNPELVPVREEIFHWISEIFNMGIRRPGYPANFQVIDWIKNQFQSFGLQKVTLEPVNIKKWESFGGEITLWLKCNPQTLVKVPCYPIPYTKPPSDLIAELCYFPGEDPISGKIALSRFELYKFPIKLLKKYPGVDRYYDPENEFEILEQTIPFNRRMFSTLDEAISNRGLGLIEILSGYPWDTDKYYVPYDAQIRGIPGVYVSDKNGMKITELLAQGTVVAKIEYEAKTTPEVSYNVLGSLKGRAKDNIVIGTHHDGPWNSAVEDASGMALVLALAKYWSQIPENQRPFNLVFVMTCAHMAGAAGTQNFVQSHEKLLKNTLIALHLEHVARDVTSNDGEMLILEDPTVRWWFVSRILPLEEIVENVIFQEGLERSILLPPDGFPPGSDAPPTDGHYYHLNGIPIISFLTAPPYLFDPSDTLDKVHQDSLEPLVRAAIKIINSLGEYSAADLRKIILTKSERRKLRKVELRKKK